MSISIMPYTKQILLLTVLVGIFFYSVFVRLPNINRPIALHHEWLSAHMLNTARVLYENGPTQYHFSPVYNFNNDSDKWIILFNLGGVYDSLGNLYYLSYPPFAFLLVYFYFLITFSYPSIIGLQVLNLIIHFFSALGIMIIINQFFNKTVKDGVFIPSLIGFIAYLFNPLTLWFGSNVFFVDVLAQFIWIWAIYFVLRLYKKSETKNGYWLLGLTLFLLIYTEWIGLFFALAVFLAGLFVLKNRKVLVLSILVPIVTLALIVLQYSSIGGIGQMFTALSAKFSMRSGLVNLDSTQGLSFNSLPDYMPVLGWYSANYIDLLAYIVFIVILGLALKSKEVIYLNGKFKLFLILSLIPIFLHHLLFYNFSVVHDFSALKGAVFLSVVCGAFYGKFIDFEKKLSVVNILGITGCIVLVNYSVLNYKNANPANLPEYNNSVKIGEYIKKNSTVDEVIFSNSDYFDDPPVLFYAERNVVVCPNVDCAKDFLRAHNSLKGKMFFSTNYPDIDNMITITSE